MGFVFYRDLALSSDGGFNHSPFGYVLVYAIVKEQNLNLKCLRQTKIELIDIRKKKKIRNQIRMESIVLLLSTIAVTGLAVFIIFWLFVVHVI